MLEVGCSRLVLPLVHLLGGQDPKDSQGTIRGNVYKARARVDVDNDRKLYVNTTEQCALAEDTQLC